MTHVREESEENEDEDDNDVVTQTVSHAQACQALETVLAYLEQQPEIPMSYLMASLFRLQGREFRP